MRSGHSAPPAWAFFYDSDESLPEETDDFAGIYAWAAGSWSGWVEYSASHLQRTRSVWCRRNDGQTVTASLCTAAKPATSELSASPYGYEWALNLMYTEYTNEITLETTFDVVCQRVDNLAVRDDAFCEATPPSSTSTETVNTAWSTGAWSQWTAVNGWTEERTRTVTCVRDTDGAAISDSHCSATKPATRETRNTYSYAWAAGDWEFLSCVGDLLREEIRTYYCMASNGVAVSGANCTGTAPAPEFRTVHDPVCHGNNLIIQPQ